MRYITDIPNGDHNPRMTMITVTVRSLTLTVIALGDDDETPNHAPGLVDYDQPGVYFYRDRFWMVYPS